tara:strand:- start:1035 stop:2243 length:1209 start_codon:yes stop_codon:yes gene_type:complete
MNLSKLTDAQLAIVEKIANEAKLQGLDPNLALTIAEIETGGKFSHMSGDKVLTSPKGALGVMQLMPDTAKGLQVDPYNLDENIRGGVSLLKQHMDQYKDPVKAAVAYNTSEKTRKKFFETDDLSVLPDETINYLDKFTSSYTPEEVVSSEDVSPEEKLPVLPEVSGEAPKFEAADIPVIDPKTGLSVGATAGAIAGTAEAVPSLYNKLRGKVPIDVDAGSPGQKWAAKTGYGKGPGYSVQEVARAYEKAKSKGKVSGKLPPGETLNINEWIKQQKLAEDLASKSAGKEFFSKASKVLGRIPLGSTLVGASGGMDIAEAAQRASKGDIVGAAIKGVGGLGSLATLIPHPAPRLIGGALALGAMPAEYIYEMMEENKKRKKQGLAPLSRVPAEIEYDPMGNPIR